MRCYMWLYKHFLCPCTAPVKSPIGNHYPSTVAALGYGSNKTLNTLSQCLVIVWLHQCSFKATASVPPVNPNLLPSQGGKTHWWVPMGSQHSPAGSTAAQGSCHDETPEWQRVQQLRSYLPFGHTIRAFPIPIILASFAWPGSKVNQVCCAQAWTKTLQVQLSYNVTHYSCSITCAWLLGKMQVSPRLQGNPPTHSNFIVVKMHLLHLKFTCS